MSLAAGQNIAGKYTLVRPLARGAMGEVWVATHRTLGGELAIKFLSRITAHDGEDEQTAMARFQFEAQVAARLSRRTRHIVGVTDHGEDLGWAYLVMELVEGESLETLMRRERKCNLGILALIVAQVAKGLQAAHAEGVFHRDLKPANILLTRDEDGGLLCKILDFGIAKTVREHRVEQHAPGHSTEVGIVLGTPNYMSPEQARGLATLDHRCDLWALATLSYEALTGTLPYDGETTADLLVNICSVDPVPVRKHRPDLPASADAFFDRAFAAKVRDRFQDANELASAFQQVVAEALRGNEQPKAEPRNVPTPSVPPAPGPPRAQTQLQIAPRKDVSRPDAAPLDALDDRSISGSVHAAGYEPPRRKTGLFIALAAVMLLAVAFVGAALTRGSKTSPAAASPPASIERHDEPTPQPAPTATLAPPTSASAQPSESTPKLATTNGGSKSITHKAAPVPSTPPVATTAPAPKETAAPPPPTVTPPPAPSVKKPVDKGEIL